MSSTALLKRICRAHPFDQGCCIVTPCIANGRTVRPIPHLIPTSLDPHESAPQMASRPAPPLLRTPLQSLTMLFNGTVNPKNCPWGIEPQSNARFPGPNWVSPKTVPQSVQPLLAGLTNVTDRQTDRLITLLSV